MEWEGVRVDGEDGEHREEGRREQRMVWVPSGGPVCLALGLVRGCGWEVVSLHCVHHLREKVIGKPLFHQMK